jgi:hypothetical protein
MYLTLFRSATKAVEIIKQAQVEAEEMYIESDDTPLELIPSEPENE